MHGQQIQAWFAEHGRDYFKGLDIWDSIQPTEEKQNPSQSDAILVSAIVSTYNSEKFIRGCMQDLVEQTLYQKGQLEIIVVNSGSQQDEEAIVREFQSRYSKIQYIRTPERQTVYAAWNRGIRIARGKYITNANTDDRHAPEMLEKLATMLEADSQIALIYSHFYVTETPNQTWQNKTPSRMSEWHPEYSRQELLRACFTGPQPLWRRSLHEEYGWFDESFKVAGDYEFFLRCSQTHEFKLNKEPLGLYYHNPQSLERSAGTRDMEDAWVKQYYIDNWRRIVRRPFDPSNDKTVMIKSIRTSELLWPALSLYQQARQEYQSGNMAAAQRLIKDYYSKMDYQQLQISSSNARPANPLFSVIIVTYNRPEDLVECCRSLRQQPSDPYEIIIVDNGDAAHKAASAAHNADIYVDCPMNFFPSEARNIGAFLARGKILVFLDDDALVGQDYLNSVRKAFEKYDVIGLRGKILPKKKSIESCSTSIYDLGNSEFATISNIEGNNAFRRDAYLAVGGMDPLLFGHEGGEFNWRLVKKYNNLSAVIYWPETIIYHDYGNAQKSLGKQTCYRYNNKYIMYKHGLNFQTMKKHIESQSLKPNHSGQILSVLPETGSMLLQAQAVSGVQSSGPAALINPKISIVMSCHNEEAYLAECLDSVLAQTLTDWELLVADDGSTDRTRSILQTYAVKDKRIRLAFFDDKKGPYVRRNFAISQSRAPFISIQDADDVMMPEKLAIL